MVSTEGSTGPATNSKDKIAITSDTRVVSLVLFWFGDISGIL